MLINNNYLNNRIDNKQICYGNISVFDAVKNIESNLLLNKGITEVGGFIIPQAIMANNKDESIERSFKSSLYFLITFISPIVLLPLFNRKALSHYNISKNFKNDEKRILEVSKEYLTKDGEYLKRGIELKSQELFGNTKGFNSIIEKYGNDTEKLRKDLISAHTAIHFTDLLTTNLMVASYPWLGNLFTQYRTKRSGYSGTYKMADEEFTKKTASKTNETKKLRQALTLGLTIIPALTLPILLKKGMLNGLTSNNKVLKWFNKNAEMFDYKKAMYMSRATALALWLTGDYLPNMLASRDKYELKDNLIRITLMDVFFWGGDLLLKKVLAKCSDKMFNTHLINKDTNHPYTLDNLKNYKNIENLKHLSEKSIKKTKRAAVSLYILNLGILMGTLGFGLPILLNRMLRKRVAEDKAKVNISTPLTMKPTFIEFINQAKNR